MRKLKKKRCLGDLNEDDQESNHKFRELSLIFSMISRSRRNWGEPLLSRIYE
jgi:hypothetical protein